MKFFAYKKKDGFTSIIRANKVDLVRRQVEAGESPGSLWNQGFFEEVFAE
jgi:hypothetical protein